MTEQARCLALFALLAGGCAHTVGAPEVASRAAVELECDSAHTYVQTIARNHYSAGACGQRALYICRSGACDRDSEPALAGDARVIADGRDAHERLNAVRPLVLECTDAETLTLRATFEVDGSLGAFEHDASGIKQCLRFAFAELPPAAHSYEHPIYIEHVFSSVPWEPEERAPVAAVSESAPAVERPPPREESPPSDPSLSEPTGAADQANPAPPEAAGEP